MLKLVWNFDLFDGEQNKYVTLNLNASIRMVDDKASVADCYLCWKHLSCNRIIRLPALKVLNKKCIEQNGTDTFKTLK